MSNNKSNNKSKDFIFKLSAIMILIAAVGYLFNPIVASYIMIMGVVGFTITTFMTPYPGNSLRGKRLYNMRILGVACMAMSSYLMYTQHKEWVIPMLIAGVLLSYTAFMLPKTFDKENKQ